MLSTLLSDPHRKKTTTLILFFHNIILRTPAFMHHLGSTLSLMCFIKRDYKGKSEPNISRWQKYSAHTKVYIFRLKNNYSSSKPHVSACFVVLTKREGPFITMNESRLNFRCALAYSATVATSLAYDLWFMIYNFLLEEDKPFLHINIYNFWSSVTFFAQVNSITPDEPQNTPLQCSYTLIWGVVMYKGFVATYRLTLFQ